MKVEVISIGDEVLHGQVLNKNAAHIAEVCGKFSLAPSRIVTIGDELPCIVEALEQASQRAQLVIVSGGLGPTQDDLTREAFSQYLQVELVFSQQAWQKIEQRLQKSERPVRSSQKTQAHIPYGAEILANPYGTAVGLKIQSGETTFLAFPGVPHELRHMLQDHLVPHLKQLATQQAVCESHMFRTIGISESHLAEKLQASDWQEQARIAFLPQITGVDIAVRSYSVEKKPAIVAQIRERIQEWVYAEDSQVSLAQVVGELLVKLEKKIAIAESCTGGTLSHFMTQVPGSSRYFERGLVTYSNEAKIELLGVKEQTISKYGAVSEQCALEMANGLLQRYPVEIALATTGIAGPSGDTPEKPLGLVYIALATSNKVSIYRYIFKEPREVHQYRSSQTALRHLWIYLKQVLPC